MGRQVKFTDEQKHKETLAVLENVLDYLQRLPSVPAGVIHNPIITRLESATRPCAGFSMCALIFSHNALVAGTEEFGGAGGGGWAWVLSDLKTLLETGSGFAG